MHKFTNEYILFYLFYKHKKKKHARTHTSIAKRNGPDIYWSGSNKFISSKI